MAMNRIQFQEGMSLFEFFQHWGEEAQCEAAVEQARWPDGFRCPRCGTTAHCVLRVKARKTFQCNGCHHQTSVIAGTLFEGTKLALRVWFLAMYLISQAKTGLSALALKRAVGVSYRTAWLVHHKLMQAMVEREAGYRLSGKVQLDDAYLGGERSDGTVGRGSSNKVPFVAAVQVDAGGHPLRAKFTHLPGFTRQAIAAWAGEVLCPGTTAVSDGLACFAGVTDAGCSHEPVIVGGRKPKEVPVLEWVNTVLGNVKSGLSGAYHAFDFEKYAERYLGAIAYRFNRRFDLHALPARLLAAAVATGPHTERSIRLAETHH
jgi:transposase-like protein